MYVPTYLCMCIGDHFYKENFSLPLEDQMICAMPDIKSIPVSDDQEFIVFACDGIWYVRVKVSPFLYSNLHFPSGFS